MTKLTEKCQMTKNIANFALNKKLICLMDNKKLVETVAANLGRSSNDVNKLLEAFAGVLRARCSELDSVVVPGFGTFEPRKRNERVMVQPSTGRRMLVPPKVTLGFKVSNVLKTKLR